MEQSKSTFEQIETRLRAYHAEHGHVNIPRNVTIDGWRGGDWIARARLRYAKGTLGSERRELLESLGISWRMKRQYISVEEGLRRLMPYYRSRGHINVSRGYSIGGWRAGMWVANVKTRYSAGALSQEHIELLESYRIDWERRPFVQTDEAIRRLRSYHAEHGTIEMPTKQTIDGWSAGVWLDNAKSRHAEGRLLPEHVEALEGMGIIWRVSIHEGVERLRPYYEQHGHIEMPKDHTIDGWRAGAWVANAKSKRTKGLLTDEEERALESIGMVWRT